MGTTLTDGSQNMSTGIDEGEVRTGAVQHSTMPPWSAHLTADPLHPLTEIVAKKHATAHNRP